MILDERVFVDLHLLLIVNQTTNDTRSFKLTSFLPQFLIYYPVRIFIIRVDVVLYGGRKDIFKFLLKLIALLYAVFIMVRFTLSTFCARQTLFVNIADESFKVSGTEP